MNVTCLTCGANFFKHDYYVKTSKRHFCSRSCAAKTNNLGRTRNPAKARKCSWCMKKFYKTAKHRSTVRCQKCAEIWKSSYAKSLSLKDYYSRDSIKDKHPSWRHSHVRVLNRSWNKDLLAFACQNCNYDKHVELCHIKPIAEFDLHSTLGEINSPENLLVLCRNCHWEFDNNLLRKENISKRALSN